MCLPGPNCQFARSKLKTRFLGCFRAFQASPWVARKELTNESTPFHCLTQFKGQLSAGKHNSLYLCAINLNFYSNEEDSTIARSYGCRGVRTARVAAAEKELDRFLKEHGYKKGTVEKLADYSAQQPVTDAEKEIFDAACSSYQFPLGTPQTVGKRQTPDGTDYKYTVKSRGFNGEEATSVIYVTVGKEAGAKPEFTQVVR